MKLYTWLSAICHQRASFVASELENGQYVKCLVIIIHTTALMQGNSDRLLAIGELIKKRNSIKLYISFWNILSLNLRLYSVHV